ncbi:hypothetical protein LNTAR_07294 [Lentisphaera araneosa HTCC2155]|uniref:ATPase AAA-type core domain-containing protein n=1 Tax=Lentisphaera araneosa HTCC2155 TaxID=313628 RepID=A6DMZ4_9BACT|nr:AAA family ATPase [Lentisphaera araneosa]EDM27030.1 hypothetical protein LNTAR_07294 [Lentisphaera araneosa HTCC2155]
MLCRFSVKNFKSFEDEFTFDLTTTKNFEFNQECIKDNTAFKALIYGINGCGKSNLGSALMDIQFHLTDWDLREKRSAYNNYINAFTKEKCADFKYEFAFGENIVIYEYTKENLDNVLAEKLSINGQVVATIDKRKSSKGTVTLKGAESLKTDLADNNISFIKYISNNTLLDERDINVKVFTKLMKFIRFMRLIKTVDTHKTMSYKASLASHHILSKKNGLQEFEQFLNNSNIKCKLTTIDVGEDEPHIAFDYGSKSISFFDVASTGTLALGHLYVSLLILEKHVNEHGSTFIYIDEFDAFYHYLLATEMVKKLKENSNVQIVLTTHNTDLMTNELMRPDCLFNMTENSIKPFHKLTNKDLRKAHNNQKMFKAGMFNEL